jgi:hypothetical protein
MDNMGNIIAVKSLMVPYPYQVKTSQIYPDRCFFINLVTNEASWTLPRTLFEHDDGESKNSDEVVIDKTTTTTTTTNKEEVKRRATTTSPVARNAVSYTFPPSAPFLSSHHHSHHQGKNSLFSRQRNENRVSFHDRRKFNIQDNSDHGYQQQQQQQQQHSSPPPPHNSVTTPTPIRTCEATASKLVSSVGGIRLPSISRISSFMPEFNKRKVYMFTYIYRSNQIRKKR